MTEQEQSALVDVAREAIKEIRSRRRWKWVSRIVWWVIAFFVLAAVVAVRGGDGKRLSVEPFIAYVEVNGVISDSDYANALDINEALREAFEDKNTRAVFLAINSPGGSPVQSGQVYREIRRLKAEHKDIPVYAFISDMGASGAYFIAAAADKIYADPASVVGSIGVISHGYGYGDLITKLGVQDRTHKSGEHKDFLNPAKPEKPEEVAHMQGVLDDLHRQFIDAVKTGRGERLKTEAHPELFSGLFWSGAQALDLGLVDSLDDMSVVVKREFDDIPLLDFTKQISPVEQLLRRTSMQSKASLRQLGGLGEKVEAILR